MRKKARIFISGGGGFVGSHLCKYMTRKGIDILTTEDAGSKSGSKLDITDLPKLLAIPDEVEAVIHLAAKTSVGNSFRYAHDTYYTNLLGTLNLLEFAIEKKVSKFINMSTYLYGQPKYLPVDEKHPINPYSPYNKSKLLAEQLCQFYAHDFGMDIITLRPFYLYGSRSRAGSFIQSALEQINNKSSVILSGRSTRRDFLFIDDFVNLVDIILSKFPKGYNVYNVGYGKSYLLVEVSEILAKLLNKKISIKYDDRMRPGDVTEMIADISKISSEFKWKPLVSLESGLEYTLKQYLSPSHS